MGEAAKLIPLTQNTSGASGEDDYFIRVEVQTNFSEGENNEKTTAFNLLCFER